MSQYVRVSNREENDDVQDVELFAPANPVASTSRSDSPTDETAPMVNQNTQGSSSENLIVVNDTAPPTTTNRLSILNKITRKPNNPQPVTLPTSNDGVFSNLAAKPTREAEKDEENPPPYETAAADAAPPYWETTIIAPGMTADEILVEGLPVGNVFSFVWNMLVSMSFQFVGFLLTYLLHTTHAAKNGSRAGLGITLVQYGFYLRGRALQEESYSYYGDEDVNEKEMLARNAWLSYLLMFLGWFIVIRSISDQIRVKRMEAVMRTTPEENV